MLSLQAQLPNLHAPRSCRGSANSENNTQLSLKCLSMNFVALLFHNLLQAWRFWQLHLGRARPRFQITCAAVANHVSSPLLEICDTYWRAFSNRLWLLFACSGKWLPLLDSKFKCLDLTEDASCIERSVFLQPNWVQHSRVTPLLAVFSI